MSAALTYFAEPPLRSLTPVQAQKLADVPVRFGDGGSGPTYVKTGKPSRRAGTCREFEAAARDGFEHRRTARRRARHRSYLAGRPSGGAVGTGPAQLRRRGAPRAYLDRHVRTHGCRVMVATATELQLRCGDLLYALTELFRADVEGNGVASIVVAPDMRSLTGTLAVPAPAVALSRTSANALLRPRAISPRAPSGQ